MKALFYCLATTIAFCGCDTSVNDSNSYDYSVEQKLGCFCPHGGVWVKLSVRADTVADAITISDNNRLSYQEARRYKSIKGLFEVISEIDTARYDVRTTFDSLNNYPSYIYFNPKPIVHGDTVQAIFDAQMSYTTRNYIKLN
jgi:hypothetical protein